MRRDKVGTPPPASASLSAEPVTQIDNLPVRATAPAHLVGDGNPSRDERPERSERREGSDRPGRYERRERGGRDDRGERGGRGGRDDRGRGRRQSNDRRNSDDRPPATTWEAPAEETPSEADFEPAERNLVPDESPDLIEQEDQDDEIEETEENPRQRRGPRFEAADDEASNRSHLIQEFKPSRHADRSTSARSGQTGPEKKGSLMGWIKSVFTGGEQSTQTPESKPSEAPSGDRRSGGRSGDRGRGSRSRGQGGRGPNQGPQSGGTDGEGRPRRRRRRGGGGGGGGRGRGGRPDGNRRPPREG